MKVAVDAARLEVVVQAEAERHPVRTPERRIAASLWVALITTTSIAGARKALAEFAEPEATVAALELLGRLILKGTSE